VIEGAVGVFRRGPGFPAKLWLKQMGVALAGERGLVGAVLFEAIEVLQEEKPGRLLGVVEFGGATGFLAEDVVDVSKGLFEQGCGVHPPKVRGQRV